MKWHDWCEKPLGVDPRQGGCPCPKTQAEQYTLHHRVKARHEEAVNRAADNRRDDPSGWLTTHHWSLIHLFKGEEMESACGRVSRYDRKVAPLPGGRRCEPCARASRSTTEGESS